jgi:hypothetical protein
MTARRPAFLIALVVLSPAASQVAAQSLEPSLMALRSDIAATRIAGLDSLMALSRRKNFPVCSPQASRAVKTGLIAGLEKENQAANVPGGSMSEDEADEFYPNLIGCVAALHETAAVPGLLDAITTGGGAIGGLTSLGDAAVPSLLTAIDSGAEGNRAFVLLALGKLASGEGGSSISAANRDAIRAHALTALASPNRLVKSGAITALRSYSDPEVRRAIWTLAAEASSNHNAAVARQDFPVRAAARAWLRQDSLRTLKAPR